MEFLQRAQMLINLYFVTRDVSVLLDVELKLLFDLIKHHGQKEQEGDKVQLQTFLTLVQGPSQGSLGFPLHIKLEREREREREREKERSLSICWESNRGRAVRSTITILTYLQHNCI
jgi:hypothetical protein